MILVLTRVKRVSTQMIKSTYSIIMNIVNTAKSYQK